ncbi:MAG: hypothetical protein SCH98_04990 [Deferrisomatales bacterium]|nr:hypothetical protein [Deferrisomatales bacterium]
MRTRFLPLGLAPLLWLAATPATAATRTVAEREPNHEMTSPQVLGAPGGVLRVTAVMGELNANPYVDDLDYYQVFLKANDVVTIAVENGYAGGAQRVRLSIALFQPALAPLAASSPVSSTYEIARVAGSLFGPLEDPKIEDYVAPRTGNYIIGVCSLPRYFDVNGHLVDYGFPSGNGDYDLVISGTASERLTVPISVKPGSTELAPFNPKAQGRLPVAILSTPGFSPLDIDLQSLRFGASGDEESFLSCQGDRGRHGPQGEDLNGDGIPDLICHFDRPTAGFALGDLEGVLTGTTKADAAFVGRGALKIVPAGR